MTYILFVLGWIVCAVVAHGIIFAYFQGAFPVLAENGYWDDMFNSLLASLFGPIALIAAIIFVFFTSRHGYQGFRLF